MDQPTQTTQTGGRRNVRAMTIDDFSRDRVDEQRESLIAKLALQPVESVPPLQNQPVGSKEPEAATLPPNLPHGNRSAERRSSVEQEQLERETAILALRDAQVVQTRRSSLGEDRVATQVAADKASTLSLEGLNSSDGQSSPGRPRLPTSVRDLPEGAVAALRAKIDSALGSTDANEVRKVLAEVELSPRRASNELGAAYTSLKQWAHKLSTNKQHSAQPQHTQDQSTKLDTIQIQGSVSKPGWTDTEELDQQQQEALELFNEFDSDGSGEISFVEFCALIKQEAWIYELSEDEIQLAWSRIDSDGSGTIEAQEFARWWRGGTGTRFKQLACTPSERKRLEWAAKVFRDADVNGSATIDVEEYRENLHNKLRQENLLPRDLLSPDAAIGELDKNGNGVVEFTEFLHWLHRRGQFSALESPNQPRVIQKDRSPRSPRRKRLVHQEMSNLQTPALPPPPVLPPREPVRLKSAAKGVLMAISAAKSKDPQRLAGDQNSKSKERIVELDDASEQLAQKSSRFDEPSTSHQIAGETSSCPETSCNTDKHSALLQSQHVLDSPRIHRARAELNNAREQTAKQVNDIAKHRAITNAARKSRLKMRASERENWRLQLREENEAATRAERKHLREREAKLREKLALEEQARKSAEKRAAEAERLLAIEQKKTAKVSSPERSSLIAVTREAANYETEGAPAALRCNRTLQVQPTAFDSERNPSLSGPNLTLRQGQRDRRQRMAQRHITRESWAHTSVLNGIDRHLVVAEMSLRQSSPTREGYRHTGYKISSTPRRTTNSFIELGSWTSDSSI